MASRWSTPSATRRDSATRTASCSRARSGGADFVSYRIGFDVGGTFTDFVLQSPAGELTTAKRLTTYPDPSEACLAGLDALLAAAGVAWSDVAQAVHGTTLGSNVVIERKARGVGLLTTRGFRDVLLIGREKRYQVYDLQIEKPRPLVPRRLIGEVTERVLADGRVRTPLDEADARRAIRELAARGVTTLAVCLLHAYLNPVHEKRLAALVAEEAPQVAVTLSHEVSPTFREYERTSTTVVNAYVMSAVRTYLHGLQAALKERGYRGRLFVMQSSGGIATAEAMERYPVRMIESGPAAGALMAAAYGELTGHRDLIAFDMGGTTAKLALVENGRPGTTTAFELHRVNNAPGSGLPMNIQAIDLVEIGAGGGSIARASLGVIAVGPESASSMPGPVCYGRGGLEPTVTDANLALGYLNADYFAGGTMTLDGVGAARAITGRVDAVDVAFVSASYDDMTRQAAEVVRESVVEGDVVIARSADARYVGQGYELTVPVPAGVLDAAALADVRRSFDEIYAARYGYANPSEPIEIVTWKLSATGQTSPVRLRRASETGRARHTGEEAGESSARKPGRRAWFPETDGWIDTPVYDRYRLAPGHCLRGPAIVEERESTTVLPPGVTATVDDYASLIVSVRP